MEACGEVRPLFSHIDQSFNGAIAGRRCDFGPLLFNSSDSQRWLTAEGSLLAVLPAAGGISSSSLKGVLGSASQYPPQ